MNKKRNGEIDFWKFIFSLVIVQFHSSNLAPGKTVPFIGGALAVEFFFLVSGFLMASSISRYKEEEIIVGRDTRHFLFHKIQGLCPEILIAWGIGYVVYHIAKEDRTGFLLFKNLMTGFWDICLLRESGLSGFRSNPAAWYLSAMLLAMLLLVPLFLKNREFFLHVLAPFIFLFTMGYLCQNVGNLRGPTDWLGFCYKGLLRAIGELALGCICWQVCQKVKGCPLTKFAKILLTLLELLCYIGAIVWMYYHQASKMDFVVLLLFAVGVTITFSNQNVLLPLFQNAFVYFLGRISFCIYLAHSFWLSYLVKQYPKQSYLQRWEKYVMLVGMTTCAIYLGAKVVRILISCWRTKMRDFFVRTEVE